jgi:hypothetical protein
MEKSLDALGQVLRANPALQAQLKSAGNQQEYVQRAVQIGKENGVEVNRAALEAALLQAPAPSGPGRELSVDQLESVAGGRMSDGFICRANYFLFTSGYLKC